MFKLYMKGSLIEEVNEYKYLGKCIDDKLSGDPQFRHLRIDSSQ